MTVEPQEYTPTLRDQFAMAALTGMALPVVSSFNPDHNYVNQIIDSAYIYADAMMEKKRK